MSDTTSERRLRRRQPEFESASASPPADAVPSPAGASPAGEGWRPIDAKALSGVPVFVRGANGERAEAIYALSRMRVGLKWAPIHVWRDRNNANMGLSFEPVEYHEIGFAPLYQPAIDP